MDLSKLFKVIEEEGKIQLSESFKTTVENTFKAAVAEKDIALDEAKKREDALTTQNTELTAKIEEMKTSSLDEVKKEVETFKEGLVEKISSFMEIELDKMLPEDVAVKVAKAEIYEPIVESLKASVARYGIVIESEGMTLLKEAREEISKLRSEFDEVTKTNLELKSVNEKNEAVMTLMEKMEGLTDDQQKKIVTIFKGKSADEINERFDEVRDLIIGTPATKIEDPAPAAPTKVVENVEPAPATPEKLEEAVEDLGQRFI